MKTHGTNWQEFKQELLTESERREIEDKADYISAIRALNNAKKTIPLEDVLAEFEDEL